MAEAPERDYLDELDAEVRERELMLDERSRRLYPGFPSRIQRKRDMAAYRNRERMEETCQPICPTIRKRKA
ncbi:MAG: hypothetical protein M3511_14945 [Deinococcota bacterium]|nr:hypothetical protein [Deinococcota bacterium]